jgi:Foie gras liver health family 1/Gryzun, putative trafficking through Golgi
MQEYPREVRERIRVVVALVGEQDRNLHARICDRMTKISVDIASPSQKVPLLNTISLSLGESIRRRKEKRSTYEGYVVRGLLKANWMARHALYLPAAVVLFLPWHEPSPLQWRQTEASLLASIERARQSIAHDRHVRLLVCLVKYGNNPDLQQQQQNGSTSATSTTTTTASAKTTHNNNNNNNNNVPKSKKKKKKAKKDRKKKDVGDDDVGNNNDSSLSSSPASPRQHHHESASDSPRLSASDASSLSSSSPSASLASYAGSSSPKTSSSIDVLDADGLPVVTSEEGYLSSLHRRANLTERQLMFFNASNDDEFGASLKELERVATELSALYYQDEMKRAKKVRDMVKKSHPELLVRQNIKIGFLAEFQNDLVAASNYYTAAFRHLRELSSSLERRQAQEVRCVADFINFKLCKILLVHRNQLNQAVQQFDRHVKAFRKAVGYVDQQFLYWAWLSRQYEVFGQLMSHYLYGKTTVPKHLHAGFYYHAAASHARQRKLCAQRLLARARSDRLFKLALGQVSAPTASIVVGRLGYYGRHTGGVALSALSHPLAANDVGTGGGGGGDPLGVDASSSSSSPLPSSTSSAPATALENVELRDHQQPSAGTDDDEDDANEAKLHMAHARALAAESFVLHQKQIIALLLRSFEQYKATKRSARMVLQIESEMAAEHCASLSPESQNIAKNLFDRVARHYRREQWWSLLAFALQQAAQCARHLSLGTDLACYTLELLQPQMAPLLGALPIAGDAVDGDTVAASSSSSAAAAATAAAASSSSSSSASSPVGSKPGAEQRRALQRQLSALLADPKSLDVHPINSLIQLCMDTPHALVNARAHFTQESAHAGDTMTFAVQLTLRLEEPMVFDELRAEFDDVEYNRTLDEPLILQPDTPTLVQFELVARQKAELACTKLLLLAKPADAGDGNAADLDEQACIQLMWSVSSWTLPHSHLLPSNSFDAYEPDAFMVRPHIKIADPKPTVSIALDFDGPALVNEFFRLRILIDNGSGSESESEAVASSSIGFEVEADQAKTTAFYHGSNLHKPVQRLAVGALPARSKFETVVFIYSSQLCTRRRMAIKYAYSTDSHSTMAQQLVDIPVHKPIDVRWNVYSSNFAMIGTESSTDAVVVNRPFLLRLQLEGRASPIDFFNFRIDLDPQYAVAIGATDTRSSQLINCESNNNNNDDDDDDDASSSSSSTSKRKLATLSKGGHYTLWYQVNPVATTGNTVSKMGKVTMMWRRANEDDVPLNVIAIPVPTLKIATTPFRTNIEGPYEALVGQLVPITLSIHNASDLLEELQFQVKDNDSFLFSGIKRCSFKLLPHATHVVTHHFVPIAVGKVALPQFVVQSKRYNTDIISAKQRRHVFVRPHHVS